MERPLSNSRPIGPFAQLGNSPDDKDVMGVSGVPMPNRPKNNMVLIYKLQGDNPVFVDDFARAIQDDIRDTTMFSDARVTFKRHGRSAKTDFDEQAVILQVRGDELPFEDSEIHRVEDVISRIASTMDVDVSVSEIFIEQE